MYLKGSRETRRTSFKEGADLICILGRPLLLQWGLDGGKVEGREISGCCYSSEQLQDRDSRDTKYVLNSDMLQMCCYLQETHPER